MLTKKSKYAIKALIVLAKAYGTGEPTRIPAISEAEQIPRKFLEAILLELRNKGMLTSRKGLNGGYSLLRPPTEIMLSDVIRITDGPIALLPCVSLNFYEACEECPDEATCSIREIALEVRDASLKILAKTSLQDMVNREKKTQRKSATKKS